MSFVSSSAKFATVTSSTNQSKRLYKYLIRQCQRLPKGPKEHYQFMIKQSYKQHVNEKDEERIEQIIKRAYENAEWILKKYLDKDNKT